MDIPPIPKVKAPVFTRPHRSVMLELILLLVVAGLLYFFLIRPKQASLSVLQGKYNSLSAQSNSVENDTNKLKQLITQMRADASSIGKLDEALPLNSKTTYVQLLLSQLAQQSGVVVGDISVAPISDQPVAGNRDLLNNYFGTVRTLKTVPATLTAEGTIDQLELLLQKLQASARIIDIVSLDVGAGKNNLLDFKISLNTYSYE